MIADPSMCEFASENELEPSDERVSLAERVAALSKSTAYPEHSQAITCIETHMSWVFLTDAHAYKLKKPIVTPHLDHKSLEARQRACQLELTLNRRLAADVYLAVVPLAREDGGLRVEGSGRAVDWLVKMRRLASEHMLDVCIERGTVKPEAIDRLVQRLWAFYKSTEPAPMSAPAYRARLGVDIEEKFASLGQPRYELVREDLDALVIELRRWLAANEALLGSRAACVVDAHGDMRPEHVCLEAEPTVIDCLEFDHDLRLLDPWSELSFLALECRRLGAAWIGARVFARFSDASGAAAPTTLLSFYQGYHALVRAAVSIWHLDDDGIDHTSRFRARAQTYLRLGRQCLSGA